MKVAIVIICLMGAVCANPILHGVQVVLDPSESELNTTQSLSASESSDQSDTSELQSSEENTSEVTSEDQTSESESVSESESLETNSEDESSEESQSKSIEDRSASDVKGVTRDNSLGSEENVRKAWLRVFANVIRVQSAEDNSSSAEDKVQTTTSATPTLPSETSHSESSESSDTTAGDSSETSETSETSDSSDTSESTESDASDSGERQQMRDCQQEGHSDSMACSSEEYPFQDIGDDDHHPVGHLVESEEEHREFSLRR